MIWKALLKGKWGKSGSFLGNSCVLEASEKTACAKKRDQSYFWCILDRFFEVKIKKLEQRQNERHSLNLWRLEEQSLRMIDKIFWSINQLNFWSYFHFIFWMHALGVYSLNSQDSQNTQTFNMYFCELGEYFNT